MVLGSSVLIGNLHGQIKNNDDNHKDYGGWMGILFIAMLLIVIGVGVWWIYAMLTFKFPPHYVLVVLFLGVFLDPVIGLVAAYALREGPK